jgi:protein SCO1
VKTLSLTLIAAAALLTALAGCEKAGAPGSSATAAGVTSVTTTAAPTAPAVPFQGADITGADYARNLSLPDVNGRPRTLAEFKGKVVVVFFGYTQCPDVCPTTMAELAQVKKSLGADGDKLQGVFVSIDPERDTPEILKAYISSFDPSFVALRGSVEQTEAAAKDFKIYFGKVPGKTEGSYTMDHTAGAFIIDAKGNPRLFERYGGGADALTSDIKSLMAIG